MIVQSVQVGFTSFLLAVRTCTVSTASEKVMKLYRIVCLHFLHPRRKGSPYII